MTPSEVRGDPSAIDAAWLTTTLENSGVADGAQVVEVKLDAFIGTGQMARNARFQLTWDRPQGRPTSLVAKLPAEDATARATGFEHGSYVKEWLFYNTLRPTVGIRTPNIYAALYDEAKPDFVLLMEDLAHSAQGDQMRGLSVDEAALAVEQLVALHAPRWGDPTVGELLGYAPEQRVMLAGVYAMMVEPALERQGPRVGPETMKVARDIVPLIENWALGTGTPSTLVHMDYRPDNFLFATHESAPPLVVVDWQTISYVMGANDLAYVIGGSFEPEQRAAVERDLVADYAARVRAAGIDYTDDTCWRDYRVGSAWGVIMSVIATILAEQTERGDEMLSTMLRRHAHHALDLDALTLLGTLQ